VNISFTIPGPPVPKVRMTQKTKWRGRARRSLDYQEYIAWCATAAKVPMFKGHVELTVKICLGSRGRADLSNLIKAVEDGIEYAGVVDNDRQILRYGPGTGIYLGFREEQVEIKVREIEEDELCPGKRG
jgi:crossover junction endodeoxyribonuclease RusA